MPPSPRSDLVDLAQVAEHNLALDLAPVIQDTVNKLCRYTGAEEEVYDLPYKLDVAQLVSKGTKDSGGRKIRKFQLPGVRMNVAYAMMPDQWTAFPRRLERLPHPGLKTGLIAGPRYAGFLADDMETAKFTDHSTQVRDQGFASSFEIGGEDHVLFLKQENPYDLHPKEWNDPIDPDVTYPADYTRYRRSGTETIHLELTFKLPMPPPRFRAIPRSHPITVVKRKRESPEAGEPSQRRRL
ncbi:hypothetical protein JCM5353_007866 [Sporobolomyces roseus]